MKIKNVVFSGVMGAILATAANAAPTIASKNYVDGLVGARESALQTQITTNADAINNHAELIDANSDAITANANSITAMDAAYKQADADTLSAANKYTDDEIDKLSSGLDGATGDVTALALRVKANEDNIATHTTNIATNASGVADNKAAIDAINNADTGLLSQAKAYTDVLADGAVATNTGAIATLNGDKNTEGSVAKSIADAISASESAAANKYAEKTYVDNQDTALDGKITTNANAIGAVATLTTTEKTNTVGAINEVNANVTTLMAGVEIVGSVDNTVQTYAIPKPSDSDCDAASGLCVLSVSSDGTTLQWVDVTDTVTTDDTTGD